MDRALALAARGDLAAATAVMRALVSPTGGAARWPAAHVNLANLLADVGRGTEAMSVYARALQLDDSCFEARANAGMLGLELAEAQAGTGADADARRAEHLRAGVAHLRAATALPDGCEWFDGWFDLAVALAGLGVESEAEALHCYARAIACARKQRGAAGGHGRLAAALSNAGALLLHTGDLAGGVAHCEEACEVAEAALAAGGGAGASGGLSAPVELELRARRSEAMHNLGACLNTRRAAGDQPRALKLARAATADAERVLRAREAASTRGGAEVALAKRSLVGRLSQEATMLAASDSPALAVGPLARAEALLCGHTHWADWPAEGRRLRLQQLFLLLRVSGGRSRHARRLLLTTAREVEGAAAAVPPDRRAASAEAAHAYAALAHDAALLRAMLGEPSVAREWAARGRRATASAAGCRAAENDLSQCCLQSLWLSAVPVEGAEALTNKGRLSHSCGACVFDARDPPAAGRGEPLGPALVAPRTAVVRSDAELMSALRAMHSVRPPAHAHAKAAVPWFVKDCVVQRGQGVRVFHWPPAEGAGEDEGLPHALQPLAEGKMYVLQRAVHPPALLRAQTPSSRGEAVRFGLRVHALLAMAHAGPGAEGEGSAERLFLFVFDEAVLTLCARDGAGELACGPEPATIEHIACTSMQRFQPGFRVTDVKGPASYFWRICGGGSGSDGLVSTSYVECFKLIKLAVAAAVRGARAALTAARASAGANAAAVDESLREMSGGIGGIVGGDTDVQDGCPDASSIALQHQVFGLDFVADSSGRPFLLECNESPQFGHPAKYFCREIAEPMLHSLPLVLSAVVDTVTGRAHLPDVSIVGLHNGAEAGCGGRDGIAGRWVFVPLEK
eukprot:g2130.t1